MKTVEVSEDQLVEIAREVARGFGHSDPDQLVANGPPVEVSDPFCSRRLYAAPQPGHCFPTWRLFVGAAQLVMAQAGRLADVQFVVKAKEAEAA